MAESGHRFTHALGCVLGLGAGGHEGAVPRGQANENDGGGEEDVHPGDLPGVAVAVVQLAGDPDQGA